MENNVLLQQTNRFSAFTPITESHSYIMLRALQILTIVIHRQQLILILVVVYDNS